MVCGNTLRALTDPDTYAGSKHYADRDGDTEPNATINLDSVSEPDTITYHDPHPDAYTFADPVTEPRAHTDLYAIRGTLDADWPQASPPGPASAGHSAMPRQKK